MTNAANKKPNILMFMPDQLRYDTVGTFGNDIVKTPNIDRLAGKGAKFTNCFLQHSVCSQSRCSIFTSKYSHVDGHRGLNSLVQSYEPNFFRTLKDNGYHVAFLAPRGDLFAEGVAELSVDEYGFIVEPIMRIKDLVKNEEVNTLKELNDLWGRLFYSGSRGDSTVLDYDEAAIQSALQWLENPPKDKPWVLFLPLLFPHVPFAVEEPYFSMYDRSSMPAPVRFEDKTGYEPKFMERIRREYDTKRATSETWAELTATYYGMISRIDAQFGRVVDKLEKTNLSTNTYTFFFTDHGEYLGDYGLVEKWPSGVNDSLVHEPLVISGPGIKEGVTIDSICEMVDLGPTIFELCGIKEDFPHNGKSLLPLLTKNSPLDIAHKEYAFSEGGFLKSEEPIIEIATYPYEIKSRLQHEDTELVGRVVAIRDKEYTYVYRLYEPDELYSRTNDIHELHNLADLEEYQHVKRRMRDASLRWFLETSDHAPLRQDDRFPDVTLSSPKEQLESRK